MLAADPEAIRVIQEWVQKAEEQHLLSGYATITRYPGDYGAIPLAEARAAVKIARRVRRQVRKRLPKEALKSS